MWLDCNQAFVQADKIDYVSFGEDEGFPAAFVYFSGRERPLILLADSLEEIVVYFERCFTAV